MTSLIKGAIVIGLTLLAGCSREPISTIPFTISFNQTRAGSCEVVGSESLELSVSAALLVAQDLKLENVDYVKKFPDTDAAARFAAEHVSEPRIGILDIVRTGGGHIDVMFGRGRIIGYCLRKTSKHGYMLQKSKDLFGG